MQFRAGGLRMPLQTSIHRDTLRQLFPLAGEFDAPLHPPDVAILRPSTTFVPISFHAGSIAGYGLRTLGVH